MMILNILLYSSGIIAESLACIPLATIWEPWLMGKCMDKKILDITTAYFNLVMDLFILLLPQTVIWKLQMSRNKKIGVSIIFSFGVLYGGTTRPVTIKRVANYELGPLCRQPDGCTRTRFFLMLMRVTPTTASLNSTSGDLSRLHA